MCPYLTRLASYRTVDWGVADLVFLVRALSVWNAESMGKLNLRTPKGGSCCYRTPKALRASFKGSDTSTPRRQGDRQQEMTTVEQLSLRKSLRCPSQLFENLRETRKRVRVGAQE